MPPTSFANLLGAAVIAFATWLVPAALGWLRVDLPVQIVAILGLAFLLFLAGMEIDLDRLRGARAPAERHELRGLLLSGPHRRLGAYATGLIRSPLLIAIVLLATSLGLVVPVLKDAKEESTAFGQLVIAAASIADFGAVILLSLFFSVEASSILTKLLLLAGFALVVALVVLGETILAAFLAGATVRLIDQHQRRWEYAQIPSGF